MNWLSINQHGTFGGGGKGGGATIHETSMSLQILLSHCHKYGLRSHINSAISLTPCWVSKVKHKRKEGTWGKKILTVRGKDIFLSPYFPLPLGLSLLAEGQFSGYICRLFSEQPCKPSEAFYDHCFLASFILNFGTQGLLGNRKWEKK